MAMPTNSALASKATGFPIAKIATKLACGYTLDELPNDITRETPACFEPTIDYCVTKIPRWTFEKFPEADETLGTQMKSVGEAMSIGRTFKESLQKGIRSMEVKRYGLGLDGADKWLSAKRGETTGSGEPIDYPIEESKLNRKLSVPSQGRMYYIRYALKMGMSVEEVCEKTMIDPWFIVHLKELVDFEDVLEATSLEAVDEATLREAKELGYSDIQLSTIWQACPDAVRAKRKALGIEPVYKLVDTCSAEFEAATPYYYSTYETPLKTVDPATGEVTEFVDDEVRVTDKKKIVILGGGPNRIGQGIEFDYCCVHAAFAIRDSSYDSIMVNCNPETVSTDYDTSDKLYFEPLTVEDVLSIYHKEKPKGVIIQFGGQTPLNIANELAEAGVNILGTSPKTIDLAEDRDRFREVISALGIPQPDSGMASTLDQALEIAGKIGYPLMVRPSYVLGGRGMEVVLDEEMLKFYMAAAVDISPERPILIDKFLQNAIEAEADAIADGTDAFVPAVMEHIELAGVHSGDSACVIPPVSIPQKHIDTIKEYTKKIAIELNVVGLMNIQYAIADDKVYILEANPRASRTVPLVSKICNIPMARLATQIVLGAKLSDLNLAEKQFSHFGVKEAVFPFNMFPEVDPLLGPEMRSTGEVLGIADSFGLAFYKAQQATQTPLPREGGILITIADLDKTPILEPVTLFKDLGFKIFATSGTQRFLADNGIDAEKIEKLGHGRPDIVDRMKNSEIHLVVNTPAGKESQEDDSYIRKTAIAYKIPYITTAAAALAAAKGIGDRKVMAIEVKSLQDYHKGIK